ncbi:MAG TPA: hypothetical protein VH475_14200 [Tepidisphaeraceae bacterium]
MTFCNDVDLLYWEPDVMRDAAFASQTLNSGTGDLAGTAFTKTAGAAFDTQAVAAGQVLVLSGTAEGCYVITGVTSASALAVSVLYDELFPESGSPPASIGAPASAMGATFAVRTFWAQRRVVSDLLSQAVGIIPGTEEAVTMSILNPEALKRACVLGTLQMIYSAVAAAADDPAKFSTRADLYERLYRRALVRALVDVDLDGDGRADVRRSPGLVRMFRE